MEEEVIGVILRDIKGEGKVIGPAAADEGGGGGCACCIGDLKECCSGISACGMSGGYEGGAYW